MSKLIDDILSYHLCKYTDSKGNWWIARPLNKKPIKKRIIDAFRVLRGRSFACHYKQDEEDDNERIRSNKKNRRS